MLIILNNYLIYVKRKCENMNDDIINKIVSELKKIHIDNLVHSGSGNVNITFNFYVFGSIDDSVINIKNKK